LRLGLPFCSMSALERWVSVVISGLVIWSSAPTATPLW